MLRTVHVSMTTTVYYNVFRNMNANYNQKCLLFLFIALHLEVLQLFWSWWSGMTMPGL